MIPAVAFVPIEQVGEAVDHLQEYLPDEAQPILAYFEANYIGRPRADGGRRNPLFPIEMWSMHQRTIDGLPRTNNHVEGWHRRFQADVGAHHPNFWRFLTVLRREEALTHTEIVQAEAGDAAPAQRRLYRDVQQRIENIVHDFGNREVINFLRGIAHNFQF